MKQAVKVSQINDDKSLSSRTSLIALSALSNPKKVYFMLYSYCTGSVLAPFLKLFRYSVNKNECSIEGQNLFRSVILGAFPV